MNETPLGIEFRFGPCLIFFGTKNSQILNLKKQYPDLQFLRLKQIHSATIQTVTAETPDYQLQGDALITSERGLALCSITGDCVPVLIYCPTSQRIAAIHAGWKGVAARVVPLAIQELCTTGSSAESLRLWIGPHILQTSFEVEKDVASQILSSIDTTLDQAPETARPKDNGRFEFSLLNVLLEQVAAADVQLENVEMELRDTMTDEYFHSARRDKELSGRQISWICLAPG